MWKQTLLVRRIIGALALCFVLGWVGWFAYGRYYILRRKTDIGSGSAYYDKHNYAAAITSWQDALRVSPRVLGHPISADDRIRIHLGDAYRKNGQFDLAAAEYQSLIRLDTRTLRATTLHDQRAELKSRLAEAQEGLRRTLAHDQS